jgi:hypothetical protein
MFYHISVDSSTVTITFPLLHPDEYNIIYSHLDILGFQLTDNHELDYDPDVTQIECMTGEERVLDIVNALEAAINSCVALALEDKGEILNNGNSPLWHLATRSSIEANREAWRKVDNEE